ncbi:AAA domain-containing protein [Dietzia sp. CQ4]|uniref:AAA family ATPase n=1 Tax=Dietzia sp. (strain CQ4) TaxID=370437 RepID=UPI0015F7942E|nr:AAA family ATPase [Dietzia sp. CQ4]MBB1033441.1 AAA domain-containing protein [Dietzia sp. CQ4]
MTDSATAVTVMDACGRAGVPVLLLSAPGMGKTSLVRALAASRGERCETVLGSIREPADFGGMPMVTDEGAILHPPTWARRLVEAKVGIAFLDELTTCPPAVQAAMLAVSLDRTVGDLALPEGVQIVAGANPPECAAGGYELDPPLANRFCHVGFAPSPEDWLTGMASGWTMPTSRAVTADPGARAIRRGEILGFLRVRPDLLDAMPTDPAQRGGAWPSRRTWTMLADSLPFVRSDDADAEHALAHGLVGEGAGTEFLAWREAMDLPSPIELIADPTLIDYASERPDRVWAALSAVATWAASEGTKKAWTDAWGPLVAAAEHAGDVAGAVARSLAVSRPASASVPASAKAFRPMLTAAGLPTAPATTGEAA